MRSISLIIEHNTHSDPFEIFINWLKSKKDETDFNFSTTPELKKSALLNNPSFRFINPEGETIKIDNIRKFNQELSFSSYDNKKRYFIFFNSDRATLQAQNAALKSIEEPPTNTQIIFLTPTLDKLLPTIISRCEVTSLKKSPKHEDQSDEIVKIYKKILESKHHQLIELANDYKDRGEALRFFDELLAFLYSELHKDNSGYEKKQLSKHLQIVLKTIEMLNQNMNVKLVAENCFFDFI